MAALSSEAAAVSVLERFLSSAMEALVVETAFVAAKLLAFLVFMNGPTPCAINVLPREPAKIERLQISHLNTDEQSYPECKDSSDTEDDDEDDNDEDDQDDDADEEESSGEEDAEEGDSEDEPEANGEGGSGDDDDNEDEEDDEDDEGEDDEEEEEEEEEEDEEIVQPPAKKRK